MAKIIDLVSYKQKAKRKRIMKALPSGFKSYKIKLRKKYRINIEPINPDRDNVLRIYYSAASAIDCASGFGAKKGWKKANILRSRVHSFDVRHGNVKRMLRMLRLGIEQGLIRVTFAGQELDLVA